MPILAKLDDSHVFGNLIFFDYCGDLSISSEISNELCYKYPGKYICVAFIKGGISNVSLRGKSIKKILEKIQHQIKCLENNPYENLPTWGFIEVLTNIKKFVSEIQECDDISSTKAKDTVKLSDNEKIDLLSALNYTWGEDEMSDKSYINLIKKVSDL